MNTKIIIGTNDKGTPYAYDIKSMPHLLIAGNTGSGKTQLLHNLILQLMENNTPEEIKFIMADCNRTDLTPYNSTPYLYAPVQTDETIGLELFEWLDYEQSRVYEQFLKYRIRGIEECNEKFGKIVFPRIIVIINELANLMNYEPEKIQRSIVRIAELSKWSGIHMILSTQIASKNVVTELMKISIPTRIAFRTPTEMDSKLIIYQTGAEKLKGKGDMLFIPPDDPRPTHLQGAYISDKEIFEKLEKYKDKEPQYNEVLLYALRKTKDHVSEDTYAKADV